MSKHRGTGVPDRPEGWKRKEAGRRPIVEKVRAGRSLKPASRPGGARYCKERAGP